MRTNERTNQHLREVKITRQFAKHAEGSVLIEFGDTKVICQASVQATVPQFLKNSGQGWVTAEYGMLPRSTKDRMLREAARGKQGGRTHEIQRLIGRSLRAAVDLKALGENTIVIDCDVIQADGGTRTASITGGCIALYDALIYMYENKLVSSFPFIEFIASVSVGVYQGEMLLDLDYTEDSNAQTDMNVVMTESGGFIEIQGTAEQRTFSQNELDGMLTLAKKGIQELIKKQKASIAC